MGISKILSYDSIQITFDLQAQVALQLTTLQYLWLQR